MGSVTGACELSAAKENHDKEGIEMENVVRRQIDGRLSVIDTEDQSESMFID